MQPTKQELEKVTLPQSDLSIPSVLGRSASVHTAGVHCGTVPSNAPEVAQVKVCAVPVYPLAHDTSHVPVVVRLLQLDGTDRSSPLGMPSVHVCGVHVGAEPEKSPVLSQVYSAVSPDQPVAQLTTHVSVVVLPSHNEVSNDWSNDMALQGEG